MIPGADFFSSISPHFFSATETIYNESINPNGKAITITSTDPADGSVVDRTIIDADNIGTDTVTFSNGEGTGTVLAGFTITNSSASSIETSISCQNSSSPIIRRCVVVDNQYGIACESGSPVIINNKIAHNAYDGVLVDGAGSVPAIKNNWIYDNTRGIKCNSTTTSVVIRNNTLCLNDYGIYVTGGAGDPNICNCILWDNTDDLDNCSATFSCIKNLDSGEGNIHTDPCFVHADSYNYRLLRSSNCIDAGDPNRSYTGELDIEGQTRQACTVDIGADEVCEVHNLTQDLWYTSIQGAIDAASDSETIVVYPWTFTESIHFDHEDLVLTGTDPNNWFVVANTIIDGDDANEVVLFDSGEDAQTVLTGLTVTNGTYGIKCANASSPTIARCIVEDCNSHGIYAVSGTPTIITSKIRANGGAGIASASTSPPSVASNFIYENDKGIELVGATSVGQIVNNTIAYNVNAGIDVDVNATDPNIVNCIVWGHDTNDLVECGATYSCIQDANDAAGPGNITDDPDFAAPELGDFHLNYGSPSLTCGNMEVIGVVSSTDIDNQQWSQVSEGVAGGDAQLPPIYVDGIAGSDSNAGQSWPQAYRTIQMALSTAQPGDNIWVKAGTYLPSDGQAVVDPSHSFNLVGGVGLYGGFSGNETDLSQRDPLANPTILSGEDVHWHVVTCRDVGSECVLDGFTITGGHADYGIAGNESTLGAGIFIKNSSPRIKNCIFQDNYAWEGGAIYGIGPWFDNPGLPCCPVIENCNFIDNRAGDVGGVFFGGATYPTFINCTFSQNLAVYGSAIFVGGDGDLVWQHTLCTNCLFSKNSSIVIWIQDMLGPSLTNCTFYANGLAAPILNYWSTIELTNCISWGHGTVMASNMEFSSRSEISYCNIEGSGGSSGWTGGAFPEGDGNINMGGNIDSDPCFVDPCDPCDPCSVVGPDGILGTQDDGLRLKSDSPCIETGDDAAVPADVLTDVTGWARQRDYDHDGVYTVDMGAYEMPMIYYVDPSSGSNQYTGTAPAHEGGNIGPWETIPHAEINAVNGSTIYLLPGQYGNVLINRTTDNGRSNWADGVIFIKRPGYDRPEINTMTITGNEDSTEEGIINRFLTFDQIYFNTTNIQDYSLDIEEGGCIKATNCEMQGIAAYDPCNNAASPYLEVFSTIGGVNIGRSGGGVNDSHVRDIIINHCHIHHHVRGISLGQHQHGGIEFTYNCLHDLGGSAISVQGDPHGFLTTINYNHIYTQLHMLTKNPDDGEENVHGSGMEIRFDNLVACGNIIHGYGGTAGIRTYPGMIPYVDIGYRNMIFENNLVYDPRNPGYAVEFHDVGENFRFVNNTVIGSHTIPTYQWLGNASQGGSAYYRNALNLAGCAPNVNKSTVYVCNNILCGSIWGDLPEFKVSNNVCYSILYAGEYTDKGWADQNLDGDNEVYVDADPEGAPDKSFNIDYWDGSELVEMGKDLDTIFPKFPPDESIFQGGGDFEVFCGQRFKGKEHLRDLNAALQLSKNSPARGHAAAVYAPSVALGPVVDNFIQPPVSRDDDPDAGACEFGTWGVPALEEIPDKQVEENDNLQFVINATDPEGDPIIYSVDGLEHLPGDPTFENQTFTWNSVPYYTLEGNYQPNRHEVIFYAADATGQDAQSISIQVNALDADDDNLPDGWEIFYWGNIYDQDETGDPDEDGFNNLEEFQRASNPTEPNPMPVLYMKFDDDSSDGVLDSSSIGHTIGAPPEQNRPLLVDGAAGSAYSFDGSNDYVEIADHTSLDVDEVTLAAWIYVYGYADDQRIISKEY